MKSFKDYVTMNESAIATITLPKAKNDQEIYDRLKLLKDAGIEAQSGGRSAHTDINVSSKDVAKAKKLLGLNEKDLKDLEDEVELDEEDFSKIKPLIDKDIKQIRDNLFDDSKTISKVWRTFNAYPGDVDPRVLKSLKEVEQLMDKARQILTKI